MMCKQTSNLVYFNTDIICQPVCVASKGCYTSSVQFSYSLCVVTIVQTVNDTSLIILVYL